MFTCNIDRSHWALAVIFMEKSTIQFYDSMGGDGYKYTLALWKYLKDEWADKKGGELPNQKNWRIIGNRDYVPHQDNGFDCGVFTCVFADCLSLDRPLSFDQRYVTQCRDRIALSILNGAAM